MARHLLRLRLPRLALLVLALLVALVFACTGCRAPVLVTPNPTPSEIQQVRHDAVRIAETVTTAIVVLDEAAALTATAPLPARTKDAIDCGIIRATGLSGPPSPGVVAVCGPVAPGPGLLSKALEALKAVTSTPALRTTIVEILAVLDPLIGQLEAAGSPLAGFASILRTALTFARQLLAGGA